MKKIFIMMANDVRYRPQIRTRLLPPREVELLSIPEAEPLQPDSPQWMAPNSRAFSISRLPTMLRSRRHGRRKQCPHHHTPTAYRPWRPVMSVRVDKEQGGAVCSARLLLNRSPPDRRDHLLAACCAPSPFRPMVVLSVSTPSPDGVRRRYR